MNIPSNHDAYLTSLYGNYMQVPPVEKRERNFVFEMAWEPTKIGAIVYFDLSTKRPVVRYIRIEHDCAPSIVEETEIPEDWRFDCLNEDLMKEDNSEQYHSEIRKNYALYRRANHRYILGNMLKHPSLGITLMKDFVKRRFLK